MEEFPSEMIINIAEGDTIIFNFPLSIFNSAAEKLPGKLQFDYFRKIGYDIIDKLWKGGGWDAALSHLHECP